MRAGPASGRCRHAPQLRVHEQVRQPLPLGADAGLLEHAAELGAGQRAPVGQRGAGGVRGPGQHRRVQAQVAPPPRQGPQQPRDR